LFVLRQALMLAVAMGAARDPGCNTETSPGGVDAPCTRDKDCSNGLSCTGGVCLGPDAGAPVESDGGDAAPPSDAPHE
jgi:hypothetical protein